MRESLRIAVVPASEKAGASFVSGLLARHLSGVTERRLTLAELGRPYFYISLRMEKRFVMRRFIPYCELLKNGKSLRELNNVEEGINWALLRPGKDQSPPPAELFRFIYNVPGDIIILDCSGLERDKAMNVMAEADRKIIVVDPLPTKLMEYYSFLSELRLKFGDAVYVANKMNRGVHINEFARFLGTKNYIPLPAVKTEHIYKAEYACILPGGIREVRDTVAESLSRLENAVFS